MDSKFKQLVNRQLTASELNRLKRYASWMHQLVVREWNLSPDITRLITPTSRDANPLLRFTLQELYWWLNWTNFSFLTSFLSPQLTRIDITTNSRLSPAETVEPWVGEIPADALAAMRSAINMFPPSLKVLALRLGDGQETRLTEDISAYILKCGESLLELFSNLVFSIEALVHLMNLPNLREWTTDQEPPQVADLIRHGVPDGPASLFPSLQLLQLRGEPALGWLSFFSASKDQFPPWTLAGNLIHLTYVHPAVVVDSSLLSKFLPFTNVVELFVGEGCPLIPLLVDARCTSRFTDQDVESLAIAMPKLEVLTLGKWLCGANTCPTTVLSLLFLSVHCTKLRRLSIHFRTSNMAADVMAMVDYASSHDLHQKPKCVLNTLVLGCHIPHLEDHEVALVSAGISAIFPSLTQFGDPFNRPHQLKTKIVTFGTVQKSANLMEVLVDQLKYLRSFEEHESPSSALVSTPRLAGELDDELFKTFV